MKILTFPTGERRRTNHSDLPKNFNAHKPYDCPDRQILPRPDPPAARAIRRCTHCTPTGTRRSTSSRARISTSCTCVTCSTRSPSPRSAPSPRERGCSTWVRRRLPVRSAGDPLPRGAFHGRGLDRQENQGRTGRCGGTRPRQPHPSAPGPKRFPNGTTMWFPAP